MDYVYVEYTTSTALPNGGIHHLQKGDIYQADDPLVLAKPHLFSEIPTRVQHSQHGYIDVVEQATAAPGEKRKRK